MSSMLRTMEKRHALANGKRLKPKGKVGKRRGGGQSHGLSLRSDPNFNQYGLASALMVLAGMANIRKRLPQKAG